MTTLDDKLLGEKLQYYYSSSEDEGSDNEDGEQENKTIRDANVEEPEIDYSADGSAVNTGTAINIPKHSGNKLVTVIINGDGFLTNVFRPEGRHQ